MTPERLVLATIAIMLMFAIWHLTRERPLTMIVGSLALLFALFWFEHHPFITLVVTALTVAWWRSSQVRAAPASFLQSATSVTTAVLRRSRRARAGTQKAAIAVRIGWWFMTGLPDEIRHRTNYLRRLELRALRRVRAKCRAGVSGEPQLPTTALIMLNPNDYGKFAVLVPLIEKELAENLARRSTGVKILARPVVLLSSNENVLEGWPEARVSFSMETSVDENELTKTKVLAEPRFRRLDLESDNDEVIARGRIVFGRDLAVADVVVHDDNYVSRLHAVHDEDEAGHYLTDQRSTNRTFVNGIPLAGRRKLRHGDLIRFGRDVTFVFENSEEMTASTRGT